VKLFELRNEIRLLKIDINTISSDLRAAKKTLREAEEEMERLLNDLLHDVPGIQELEFDKEAETQRFNLLDSIYKRP
jgi:hypothetical protein